MQQRVACRHDLRKALCLLYRVDPNVIAYGITFVSLEVARAFVSASQPEAVNPWPWGCVGLVGRPTWRHRWDIDQDGTSGRPAEAYERLYPVRNPSTVTY